MMMSFYEQGTYLPKFVYGGIFLVLSPRYLDYSPINYVMSAILSM